MDISKFNAARDIVNKIESYEKLYRSMLNLQMSDEVIIKKRRLNMIEMQFVNKALINAIELELPNLRKELEKI